MQAWLHASRVCRAAAKHCTQESPACLWPAPRQQVSVTSSTAALIPAAQGSLPLLCARLFSALAAEEPAAQVTGGKQDIEVPVLNYDRQPVRAGTIVHRVDTERVAAQLAQVGMYTLPGRIFDVPVRIDIMHRVVRWQRAKRQQGTHKVKTRSEVRGGGKKPWTQKGTGRARAGTIRAPQFRGGGIVHGPVVRSHEHRLNKKVRRLGVLCALSAKAREGRLTVLETLNPTEPKTKALDLALTTLLQHPAPRSVLMIDTSKQGPDGGQSVRRAASNLPMVDLLPATGLNVYSILQRQQLIMTTHAIDLAVERLSRPINRKLPVGMASSGLPIPPPRNLAADATSEAGAADSGANSVSDASAAAKVDADVTAKIVD